ncbi:MAG: CPBP family intramembrane metalloprotease [Nitrospiraceae bacterium]|nr:CPBP family intramembrane metalloprotease [Nitrospiraceae bacterium]
MKKALFAYALLLVIVFASHAFSLRFAAYLLPIYLVAAPLALGGKITMGISARQAALTAMVSVSVLLPFLFLFLQGRSFSMPGPVMLTAQLFGVCFPEEVFFRGFIQETAGNNFRGIVLTSLLFSVAHLPAFFYSGDSYAPLTFFPSLVMGFLYLRTSSVIPSTIFHLLANAVYLGSL